MSPRCILATLVCGLALWAIFLGSLFAVGAFGSCHHSRACWKRVHAKRAHRWCLRHDICIWRHRFHAEPINWQRWAWSTGRCESGNRSNTNTGNGFYGAFQYTASTAQAAGFHARPDFTTWFEQATRSIEFAIRNGTQHWPICGRN